jgi:hypothetical protein
VPLSRPRGSFKFFDRSNSLMTKHMAQPEHRRRVACFKCVEGCIHLEYDNLMFTFTQTQFLAFSEVINETRRLLLEEHAARAAEPFGEGFTLAADALVM